MVDGQSPLFFEPPNDKNDDIDKKREHGKVYVKVSASDINLLSTFTWRISKMKVFTKIGKLVMPLEYLILKSYLEEYPDATIKFKDNDIFNFTRENLIMVDENGNSII